MLVERLHYTRVKATTSRGLRIELLPVVPYRRTTMGNVLESKGRACRVGFCQSVVKVSQPIKLQQ